MKKIIFLTFIAATTFISVGCSNTTKDLGDLNETRKIENLSITPKKITSEPAKGKNNSVTISFSVQNNGSEMIGVGAGDFYIKDSKGKEISIDGTQGNFGQEIQAKESIDGKAYFIVPNSSSKITVIYKPNQNVEAEWENLIIP